MQSNWHSNNVFVIQNGKLVPRPSGGESQPNYRYVPYDPVNNPMPEDYFRETISRLQKENTLLREQLAQKLEVETSRTSLSMSSAQREEIRQYQVQIKKLQELVQLKDRQLTEKNELIARKDRQLSDRDNENTRLYIRLNEMQKQIQLLKQMLSKKDEEILSKKEKIEEYCKVLEKRAGKEKSQARTNFSENHNTTPRLHSEQNQDQIFEESYNSGRLHHTPQAESYYLKTSQPSPYSNKVIGQTHDDNRVTSTHRVPYVGYSHYRNASNGEHVIQSTSRSQFVTAQQLGQAVQGKNMSNSTIMK